MEGPFRNNRQAWKVAIQNFDTLISSSFQVTEINRKNGYLQIVESGVSANNIMIELLKPAMICDPPATFGKLLIIGCDRTFVAKGSQALPHVQCG